MSEYTVEVRRIPWRGWYLAVVGTVMVLHGGGVLFGWYPTVRILELLYPGREAPGFESRDMAWGAAFLIVGALLIALTAGRTVVRRPVVRAGEDGILLSVGGPFARPVPVPWGHVRDISVGEVADEFSASPSLLLRVDDPGLASSALWGARWHDGVLSIPADEWDSRVEEVAETLTEAKGLRASDMEEDGSVMTSIETEQESGHDHAAGSEPEEPSNPAAGAIPEDEADNGRAHADPTRTSGRLAE
ncbi:MAG: hypothetical protein OXF41_11685 [bacterium]|nr:hypothetical protein [bacterium]